jgi:hypothetical protein
MMPRPPMRVRVSSADMVPAIAPGEPARPRRYAGDGL